MFCISVSYKKTPLKIRQHFSFTREESVLFLSGQVTEGRLTGGVVLSTCNRMELYFTTEDAAGIGVLDKALAAHLQLTEEMIKKHCLYYQGIKAIRHLYRVICGLDSMVLGEDEILRQTKEAYLLAKAHDLVNPELNIIFQDGLHCAKHIKSDTGLSKTPVSIGTLTANVVQEHLGKTAGRVMVIGATGKIGSIVVRDLLAKQISVIGTRRSHSGGVVSVERETASQKGVASSGKEDLFPKGVVSLERDAASGREAASLEKEELFRKGSLPPEQEEHMKWISFDRRYEELQEVAAVVSATSGPHYTLTLEELLKHRGKGRLLLIDLAVPPDIDRRLSGVGGIRFLNIDYFQRLSEKNNQWKRNEANRAERLLEDSIQETDKKLAIRSFMKKHADQWGSQDMKAVLFRLKEALSAEQFAGVLVMLGKDKQQA